MTQTRVTNERVQVYLRLLVQVISLQFSSCGVNTPVTADMYSAFSKAVGYSTTYHERGPAKTAEPIEMPCPGMARNRVLDGRPDSPHEKGHVRSLVSGLGG